MKCGSWESLVGLYSEESGRISWALATGTSTSLYNLKENAIFELNQIIMQFNASDQADFPASLLLAVLLISLSFLCLVIISASCKESLFSLLPRKSFHQNLIT